MPATVAQIYPLMAEAKKPSTELELLLTTPYYLSPGWLWIDPTFAPLKGDPRFEKGVAFRTSLLMLRPADGDSP